MLDNIDENYTPQMDEKFSVDGFEQINLGGASISSIIEYNFTINDFEPYIPPSFKDLEAASVEVHILVYLKWDHRMLLLCRRKYEL